MGATNPGQHRWTRREIHNAHVYADFNEIADQLEALDPLNHTKELKQVIFEGLGIVRDSEMKGIEQVIPFRTYPYTKGKRTDLKDYHKHGELRGKQYGKLSSSVKRAVSSDASGGSVSIYSRKEDNRWCVLQWLNAGTLERTTGGRTRIKKNGNVQFVSNGTGSSQQNRGSIPAQNFFLPAAQAGVGKAEAFILAKAKETLEQ